MVQIILETFRIRKRNYIYLYIPHGSDNTSRNGVLGGTIRELYIPHGSDNTRLRFSIDKLSVSRLYIPHGSDNTEYGINYLKKAIKSLYPTWFR